MVSTPASLLDQLHSPDRAGAWPRFVSLYAPLLLRWARRFGARGPDCEDLVQEVYAALLIALPAYRYDGSRSFRAWLYTIILNKWRDFHRREAAVPAHVPLDGQIPDPVNDPIAEFDEAEYRTVLISRAAALVRADFNPATWRAFWATAVEGRSTAEVASELHLSANAIYLARFRVMAQLRAELAGFLD